MIVAGIILAALARPAIAETERPTPDVIGCLKSIQHLDLGYRSLMERQCVGVAGDFCLAIDQGTGTCLPELVGSLREFYSDLLPQLPTRIEGQSLPASGYERALERAADAFEKVPNCADLKGYEFTKCEYLQLSVATVDLFYRARQADVPIH